MPGFEKKSRLKNKVPGMFWQENMAIVAEKNTYLS